MRIIAYFSPIFPLHTSHWHVQVFVHSSHASSTLNGVILVLQTTAIQTHYAGIIMLATIKKDETEEARTHDSSNGNNSQQPT